jgi:hypothetical protein
LDLAQRTEHPDITTLACVRFADFARARAGLKQAKPEIGGLFDQISEVNKTVETAQNFGERTFFYFQRLPRLLPWQTERTVEGIMDNADLQELQASVQQMAQVSQIFAKKSVSWNKGKPLPIKAGNKFRALSIR